MSTQAGRPNIGDFVSQKVKNLLSRLIVSIAIVALATNPRTVHAQLRPLVYRTEIKLATGSGITRLPKPKGPMYDITSYGAISDGPALTNQAAINNAIDAAARSGGGTVIIPAGTFKTYSIRLKSNVGLHFATTQSVIRAATPGTETGQDGGYYDAPEKNLLIGLQDEGHAHWANIRYWRE
jgi:polygalacturonase